MWVDQQVVAMYGNLRRFGFMQLGAGLGVRRLLLIMPGLNQRPGLGIGANQALGVRCTPLGLELLWVARLLPFQRESRSKAKLVGNAGMGLTAG